MGETNDKLIPKTVSKHRVWEELRYLEQSLDEPKLGKCADTALQQNHRNHNMRPKSHNDKSDHINDIVMVACSLAVLLAGWLIVFVVKVLGVV